MYRFLKFLSWGVQQVPCLLLEGFITCLSRFLFHCVRFRRRLMDSNLKKAFGEKLSQRERNHLAFSSLKSFITIIFEVLHARPGELASKVTLEFEGGEGLHFPKDSGVYMLCFHMGNWEVMCSAFSQKMRKTHYTVKKVGSTGVDSFVTERRLSNKFFPIKRRFKGDAYRQIKQALFQGEGIGFVTDQARPGEPYLPFFGHPAKTNTSFAAIWGRHPAPIYPMMAVRKSFGVHTLHIGKPLPPLSVLETKKSEKTILAQTQYLNEVTEEWIRKCPEQYFWMHNRWK